MGHVSAIAIDTAPGDLIDRITILEIKAERIDDAAKRANVTYELAVLSNARSAAIEPSARLDELTDELRSVNEALWDIEDEIRLCDRNGDFGPRFVELARSVYRTNDRRAALKREINELLGALIVEEKSYAAY